jgi:hypothetical protein
VALVDKEIIAFADPSIENPILILTPVERSTFDTAIENAIIQYKIVKMTDSIPNRDIKLAEVDVFETKFIEKEANFQISISDEMIQKVLNEYQTQIEEIGSFTNQFFAIISKIQNDNYDLFSKVFFFLNMQIDYNNGFTVQDYIEFITSNNLTFDLNTIEIFLSYFTTQKNRKMKRKLFEGYYNAFGNLYNFLIQQTIPENTGNLFYVRIENQMEKFTISPKVAYYSNETYKSFKEAEDSYWSLVSDFIDADISNDLNLASGVLTFNTTKYSTGLSERILNVSLNQGYDNFIKGIPIFMKKTSMKANFTFNKEDNDDLFKILSKSYKGIDKDEFFSLFEEMIADLVKYYENPANTDSNGNVLDYNDMNSLPDLDDFTNVKITELLTNTNFVDNNVETLKKIKFYNQFVNKFINKTSSSFINLETSLTTEFDNLNVVLLNLRTYLLVNGYFE